MLFMHVRQVQSPLKRRTCKQPDCTQAFWNSSNLNAHLIRHHRVDLKVIHRCTTNMCHMNFDTLELKYRHQHASHGDLSRLSEVCEEFHFEEGMMSHFVQNCRGRAH